MFKFLGKLVKGLLVFIGGLVVLVCCVAFMSSDSDSSSSDTENVVEEQKPSSDIDKYQIQIVDVVDDGYSTRIIGTFVADRDYSYVQILIPYYDSEGNKIGDALANVNNLNKGDSWKFEALSLDSGITYDLDKVEVDAMPQF